MSLRHLAFVAVIIAIALLAFMGMRGGPGAAYSENDPSYNAAYWEERIAADGAAAFAEFKERNRSAPLERQHLAAHVIGERIYAALGVEGIAICDAEFGFGCYHGFFGRAIGEGGEARVAELDAACVRAFGTLGTGCQHGIGHGILEYVGYDRVNDALTMCGETTETAPMLGCASGVFMEYNAPLIGAGDGLVPSPRTLTKENVYEPCTTTPSSYQDSCYYQLGQWLAPSVSDDLQELEHVCGALSGSHRSYCFMGAGEAITFLERSSVPAARASCASFSHGEDEVACNAGIAWALFASSEHRSKAREACAYTDRTLEARCIALADLTGGLDPL